MTDDMAPGFEIRIPHRQITEAGEVLVGWGIVGSHVGWAARSVRSHLRVGDWVKLVVAGGREWVGPVVSEEVEGVVIDLRRCLDSG